MRRNEKSTYLIIALACLIILNLGSMVIVMGKSTRQQEEKIGFFERVKTTFNIGNSGKDRSKDPEDWNGKDQVKSEAKGEKDWSQGSVVDDFDFELHIDEEDMEIIDDFIIIDALEDYENLIMVKDSEGRQTVENIPELLNIKKLKVDKEKPYIYIYHTHGTEAFHEDSGSNWRSKDDSRNMVSVGRIIAKVLEAGGHKVDHNKTQHDNPSYNQSYTRSINSVEKAMAAEKNLKVILDLHRDGRDPKKPGDYEKMRFQTWTTIGDKKVAKFSLVVGPMNPNYDEVLSFAKYIKAVADQLYPGLCSGIIVKKYGKFNQYVSDYAALVEVGYNLNPYEEVVETAKMVGEILDVAIRGIEE